MWKDFFYFSKIHRNGIVVLIILTVFVVLFNFALPLFFSKPDTSADIAFAEEIELFKQSLLSRDSLRRVEQERLQAERRAQFTFSNRRETQQTYSLFAFDPNEADSVTFVKLGIRPNTARSIVRFRDRGGRFRQPEDFLRIYGISEAKFEELKPYIVIRQMPETEKIVENEAVQEEISIEKLLVELNSADTTELMQIRGIGRFFAREIVRYRNELGGFASVEQLLEVRNMRTENFERIAPFVVVDDTKINKIKVNTASVERMRRHPYINFYQARAIFELRRAAGKLNNIRELARLSEFSEKDKQKLEPYLCFE